MQMSTKTMLLLIILPLAISSLFYGCAKNNKVSGPNDKNLEAYHEEMPDLWEFKRKDGTRKKSKDELDKVQQETQKLANKYNQIVFTMNDKTKNYSKKLDKLYVRDNVGITDKKQNNDIYKTFKDANTTMKFLEYTPLSFDYQVDDKQLEYVTLVGIVTVDMKNDVFEQGNYDIVMKYTIEKHNGKWRIYRTYWGKQYKHGDLKCYKENYGESILYKGQPVGGYIFEY